VPLFEPGESEGRHLAMQIGLTSNGGTDRASTSKKKEKKIKGRLTERYPFAQSDHRDLGSMGPRTKLRTAQPGVNAWGRGEMFEKGNNTLRRERKAEPEGDRPNYRSANNSLRTKVPRTAKKFLR